MASTGVATNMLFCLRKAMLVSSITILSILTMARLRGHYVADIRSGICDPNARPSIVKETVGEQTHLKM